MPRLVFAGGALTALLLSRQVAAAPCDGCVVVAAGSDAAPSPLVIVLHGDGQAPADALAPWRSHAAARGVTLFAPRVPTGSSWWRWDGPPSWIDERTLALAGVDRSRVTVAAWSGGASYLGRRTHDLPSRWRALALVGGGWAPDRRDCPAAMPPSYFLLGDKNPLHHLARDLRAYWSGCGARVEGSITAGADHPAEAALLKARAPELLDWLLAASAPPRDAGPGESRATDGSVHLAHDAQPAAAPTAPAPSRAPTTKPPTQGAPRAPRGGACRIGGPDPRVAPAGLLTLAVLIERRRRRRPTAT